MGTFAVSDVGAIDDRVTIRLHGKASPSASPAWEDVVVCETYSVACSVFAQPAAWSVTLGHGGVIRDLFDRYPPRTPFELYVGGVLQQSGRIDDRVMHGDGGGSKLTLSGRDALAPLYDDHVSDERTYKDATYLELVKRQLEMVGLGSVTVATSNRANRRVKAGVPVNELLPPRDVVTIKTEAAGSLAHTQIVARLGERRYEFCKRHLQLAGLFLWAAADGTFVLSEPNAKQTVMSSIVRRVGQSRLETNVLDYEIADRTKDRFREYSMYGRGVGSKNNHAKAKGTWVDSEMVGWGFTKIKTLRGQNPRTTAQAEFLSRKLCAEDRRQSQTFRYTVAGHTTPFTATKQRAVWTPDTLVHIDDQITGVVGDFYLSDVVFRRQPQTATELTFCKPDTLIFGPNEF